MMNLAEVLEALPKDRYVYPGTDGGSKWLFICRHTGVPPGEEEKE